MKRDVEGDYRRKILSVDALLDRIGPRPRERKVIMCHGTFDIVHPGHVRHLMYARTKGDVLVASITADQHITKANNRPFVPEDLRAMNLAALEIVDFVIVDPNPTPLENLQRIQPDIFAKGYEYQHGEIRPRTREEVRVLESYGGEVLFTPGDIVYSSSKIIEGSPPDISADKLVTLLEAESLGFADLRAALDKMKGIRVHVVGDTIVDSYSHCTLIGGNTKTPTFSVRLDHTEDFAGGAAVVAKHLRAAGADVVFTTVLGDDARRDFVMDQLREAEIRTNAVVDTTRPTTNKNAFIASGYRLLKVDTLDNRTISDRVVGEIRARIAETPADAIVFSDFRHGIFDRRTIPELIGAIPEGVYRVADSQVASRWGNILEFPDFDLVTPNEREARFALGDQDSVVRPLALELYRRAGCRTLILKLGERGCIVYRSPSSDDVRAFFALDSFARNVVDAVGSGDALLGYALLGMVATGNEVIAAVLGSLAAAIECERDGNVPVPADDVLTRLGEVERRARYE